LFASDDKMGGSIPPWTRLPSLKEMTAEAGIDELEFLEYIENGYNSREIAECLQVQEETIESLYNHFMKYGVGSVMGGD